MRFLRYSKGNSKENVASEQIDKLELGKFKDEYACGLNDPDAMVTTAREKLAAKELVMAQLGFLRAAEQFLDAGKAAEAMGTLDELAKGIPEAGVGLEAFRLKCGYFLGQGTKGAASAQAAAKKFQADATAKGWSAAALEGQFMEVLSSRAAPKEFQAALRGVVAAAGGNPDASAIAPTSSWPTACARPRASVRRARSTRRSPRRRRTYTPAPAPCSAWARRSTRARTN